MRVGDPEFRSEQAPDPAETKKAKNKPVSLFFRFLFFSIVCLHEMIWNNNVGCFFIKSWKFAFECPLYFIKVFILNIIKS